MTRRPGSPAVAVGPFERSPAQVGTVWIAAVLLAASVGLGLAPEPVVARLFVHVDGVARPGWYLGSSPGEALDAAGSDAAFSIGVPGDGDQVHVFGAYAVVEDSPAPVAWHATGQKLHLNTASLAELEALPRVGPTLAARIRAGRPFRTVDGLDAVNGIGPATIRALRPFVQP